MMKRTNPFRGLGTALVTPFHTDGSVDFETLDTLVDEQLAQGADFLCVLGTTAETPTLTDSEKRAVMDRVKERVGGRIPLLLGAGGNCTAAVCDYLRTADLSGYDGVLIVAPYYNKPSQQGLLLHYQAVAEASPLPVVLYNVPGRTGVNIEAATTLALAAECPNIVAIKEASGRIGQIEQIIAGAPKGFDVISGDDAITLPLLTLGAVGVISVVSNAYPAAFARMTHSALAGDLATALPIHRDLKKMFSLLSADGNPAGIKAVLGAQGRAENIVRLPLAVASERTTEAIQAEVERLK